MLRPGKRWPPKIGAVAAAVSVVVVVVLVTMVVTSRSTPPLQAALDELADDANFGRASDAGAAFTRISEHLAEARTGCGSRPGCDDLLTAAAFTRVGAVTVLRCRLREIFEFRVAVRVFVQEHAAGSSPAPPPNPNCEVTP